MKRIEALEIAGFRGAVRPVRIAFDAKNLVVIYGEDKAGKSTIVDALDAVCNRRYDLLAAEAAPHILLRVGGRDWMAGSDEVDGPADADEARPRALILRRAQAQQVATAPPGSRQEVIRAFIDLPGIARSEHALRAAITRVAEEAAAAAEDTARDVSTMDTLWRNAGKPGASCESWVEGKAAADLAALKAELDVFSDALNHLKAAEAAHARMTKTGEEAARSRQTAVVAEAALAEALRTSDESDPDLLEVLVRLQDYLRDRPAPDACPVCGSREKAQNLHGSVAAYLTRTEWLRTLNDRLQEAEQVQRDGEAVARQARADFAAVAAGLSWYEGKPGGWVPAVAEAMDEEAQSRLASARASRPRMTKHVGVAAKALKSINMRREVYRNWQKHGTEMRRLEEVARRLKALLTVVLAERDRYIEERLAEIAEGAGRMYSGLCPREHDSAVRIAALIRGDAPVGGASSGLGRGCAPNLDALGICLFLAVAQSSHRDGRLVVMDDVLSGADPAYLSRFLDMLEAEAPKSPPLIVTSHYQKCQERYRGQRSGKVQLIELAPWSLQSSLFFVQTRTASEQLRAQMEDPNLYDPQVAAVKAGVLLERALNFLTLHYNLRMPLQERAVYTLGPLLSGIKDNKLLLRDLGTESPGGSAAVGLEKLISAAADSAWVRNHAAHDNSGDGAHSADVETFVRAVLALSDALICEFCGDMPQTDRGTFWQCGCKKGPRLFPHKRPSA